MHQYGVPHRAMRVSNYHHETAVSTLFWLQEIEPETWDRATRRIAGIATAGQLGKGDYFIDELPFMFRSWREYRDYLLEHLVTDPAQRHQFLRQIEMYDRILPYVDPDDLAKVGVQAILVNDYHSTKLMNYYITERSRYWRAQRPARQRG
jgi:predicted phosphoadenosine phosphosulfate sulfurtransferase